MTPQATTSVESAPSTLDDPQSVEPVRAGRPLPRKKRSGVVKFLVYVLVLGAIGGGAYGILGKQKSLLAVQYVKEHVVGLSDEHPEPDVVPEKSTGPWNGLVKVAEAGQKAMGFRIIPVLSQTQPLRLELNGKTDYDQNTLNKIRPRFDNALVEKVYVSAGQSVKKGDPVMELRSAELGLAKNECRTKFVQWDHDHKYLVAREPLARDGRITQIIWTDTQNDEKKSRLDYLVSREKLATYGMNNEHIDKLLEGLSDDRKKAIEADDNTQDITRMTVCSPIDGVIVERKAVKDNFYDQTDILLTISPMTELWVWGSVFESDQDKVHLGQKWVIEFLYSKKEFDGKVESIANEVDPDTRTLRIRATIDNLGKNLVAGMLVRAILQVPPTPGDTVIPRNSLMVNKGEYYAFVQKGDSLGDSNLFERRKLEIEQENTDLVVVKKGLVAGEKVVSNGALMLDQMFEDQSTVDSGLPMQ